LHLRRLPRSLRSLAMTGAVVASRKPLNPICGLICVEQY